MKIERQIDQIITQHLPAIVSGEETLDSVAAKYPEIESELHPRLEAVIWLHNAKLSVATRPGFVHDSRKYIQNKITSTPPVSFWQRMAWQYTPQRWIFNIASSIILVILLALVMNSATLTARLSIPGDALYPTKLILEDLHLAVTFSQVERTNLHIQNTRERALEFVELVMEGKYDHLPASAARMEGEIIASIHAVNDANQSDPATDITSISILRETLSNQVFMLNVLKSTSPPSAHPGIDLAIQVAQSGVLALR
jgi:hypothetical protein